MIILRLILSAAMIALTIWICRSLLANDNWIFAFYVAQAGLYAVFLINAFLLKSDNEETD